MFDSFGKDHSQKEQVQQDYRKWYNENVHDVIQAYPDGLSDEELHDKMWHWYIGNMMLRLEAMGMAEVDQEPSYKISDKGEFYIITGLV